MNRILILFIYFFASISIVNCLSLDDLNICQYCQYAKYCSECSACPCSDGPMCGYCKYCDYCSLTKFCGACGEGGVVDKVSSAWTSFKTNILGYEKIVEAKSEADIVNLNRLQRDMKKVDPEVLKKFEENKAKDEL